MLHGESKWQDTGSQVNTSTDVKITLLILARTVTLGTVVQLMILQSPGSK